ncbi:MAG: response regulator, partial [Candidatus Hodarchaeota archaeon]
ARYLKLISGNQLVVDSLNDPRIVLDQLKEKSYDVIVCDYQMPDLDGLQLLELLRGQSLDTPFIMLTGKGREEVAINALNLGANHYIRKGGDTNALFRILFEIIRKEVKFKQTEHELKESEKILASTFQSLPDMLILINKSLQVVKSNWKEYEHVPEKVRQSKPYCYRIFMNKDAPCDPCHALEVFRTGQVLRLVKKNPVLDKTREVRVFPVLDDKKNVILVAENIRNLHEEKK